MTDERDQLKDSNDLLMREVTELRTAHEKLTLDIKERCDKVHRRCFEFFGGVYVRVCVWVSRSDNDLYIHR